jgi:hypothetical protein
MVEETWVLDCTDLDDSMYCLSNIYDECEICDGDGYAANCIDTGDCDDMDCAGVCFGEAIIDNCNECTGGTTSLEVNYLMDCAGVCDGDAMEDCSGTCIDYEYQHVCGCTDPNATNYNPEATWDDGLCGFNYVHYISADPNDNPDFTSIQEAVEYALERDTLIVYPGQYYDNITITKNLVLTSMYPNDPDSTIIEPAEERRSVITIDGDNIDNRTIISGFTVANGDIMVRLSILSPSMVITERLSSAGSIIVESGSLGYMDVSTRFFVIVILS